MTVLHDVPDLQVPARPARRAVRTLVTLGDSTPAGLGDPLPGGGWRGFPVLLRDALGAAELVNPARPGARAAWVRHEQLPVALAARPQAAVLAVGMNDTLRSDFDPVAVHADTAAAVTALRSAGAHVLLLRYHDHARVFRLPVPLQRALRHRIDAVNAVTDAVAAADPAGTGVLDLHRLPGAYDRGAWAVDRLHPSELGHRMLARGFADLLAGAGFAVPAPVSLACGGGREVTAAHRAVWLVVKGVPWLVRRGTDLGPVIAQGLVDGLRRGGRRPGPGHRPCTNRPMRTSASSGSGSAGGDHGVERLHGVTGSRWSGSGAPNASPSRS